MGPLSLLLPFAGASLGNLFSSAFTLPYKKQLAKYQNDLAKELYTYQKSNAYQLQRKDMLAAGINPAAAAFAGGSGGYIPQN